MNLNVYLYDAEGNDEKIKLDDVDVRRLGEKKLLWIDVLERSEESLDAVTGKLGLANVPCKSIIEGKRRPNINKFDNFFQFCIDSVVTRPKEAPDKTTIDFIVGKNFVVTVHHGEVDFFQEFRKREKGETAFGELDAESFVATLLDLHIVSYFRAVEELGLRVDDLDEKVLKSELETEQFLATMVELRRNVSLLRRWLMPHRDVIYALSRADFQQIAESDSIEQYKMLNQHFEGAVEAIESSRETVLSTFELYATRSAHKMNVFIQRLTFVTVLLGSLGVVAGVLGMNYKVDFFDSSGGFWLTIAAMAGFAVITTIFARRKRWV